MPPQIEHVDGVSYAAPVDGDYGGTWIWVNERRLTVCILNNYPAQSHGSENQPAHASRGHLLRDLASCQYMNDIEERLTGRSLTPYKPFFLVALLPDQPALQWTWSGHELSCRKVEDDDLPLTTSSFKTEEIIDKRVEEYRRGLPLEIPTSKEFLKNYHYSESSKRSAVTVCMEREDAQTVSMSRITVDEANIVFSYRDRDSIDGDFLAEPVTTALVPNQVSHCD